MRAVTRASRPAGVRPPWRSSRSWSLSVLTTDSIRCLIQPIGGLGRIGLVGAAGAQQEGSELARGGFEVGAGEALVADQERTLERVGLEQCERRLPFGGVGGDEVEVADGAVRGAEQDNPYLFRDTLLVLLADEALPFNNAGSKRLDFVTGHVQHCLDLDPPWQVR